MDRAATLTLEAVACSWPTPFGFLFPSAMGKIAVGGGCLAETAILFSMTRPNSSGQTVPFSGPVPLLVWLMFGAYAGVGALLLWIEVRAWRRYFRKGSDAGERSAVVSVYQAVWGRALKVASALAAAILLGVAVMPVPGHGWTRLLPLAILAGAVPFVVRGYAVQDGVLLIRRLWWNTRIDLAGLRSVRLDRESLKGSIRTCGNGGLFSFTGWYWNRRLGRYSMYVTDLKRPVVLTFDTRVVVVSPADPDAFVKELALFCKNG